MTRHRIYGRNPLRRSLRLEPLESRLVLTTFTVTSLADIPVDLGNSTVTLRDAIAAANNNVPARRDGPAGTEFDVINFQPGLAGDITLALGSLEITSNITINGLGLVTINGNSSGDRVFEVNDFTTARRLVTLSGLTIRGGEAPDLGGGVFNQEDLTILDCDITQNSAQDFGGGIYNAELARLTVQNSFITSNEVGRTFSPGRGGGIWNAGVTTIGNSTITGNVARTGFGTDGGGGGIFNDGNLIVRASTISGNSGYYGGGIRNDRSLLLEDSTIADNHAAFHGGAMSILLNGGLSAVNSTISGNRADNRGGGIYVSRSFHHTVDLESCTITENHSDNDNNDPVNLAGGGGISVDVNADTLTNLRLQNSIVADNFRGSARVNDDDIEGRAADGCENNLIGTGGFGGMSQFLNNQIGVENPGLGPLAFHGGPTFTHALLPGSPAIDRGNPNANPGSLVPIYDQRGFGFGRVANGRIDVGAIELNAPSADFDVDLDVDGFDFLAWQQGFGAAGAIAARANGNADGDADVDGADLAVWRSQFGVAGTIAAASSAAVADVVFAGDVAALMSTEASLGRGKWRSRRR